jgi:cytochrome c oxidase subunit 1
MIGTALSMLIRIELSGPGTIIGDDHLLQCYSYCSCIYNDIFLVMPVLIGGYGN